MLIGAVAAVMAASYYRWHYWTVGRFEESTDDAASRFNYRGAKGLRLGFI
jgi:multidrug resistance efflux pump